MSWQPMTPEQRAEFDELESSGSFKVGGIYREQKLFWGLNAIYPIPMAVMQIDTLAWRAENAPFEYYASLVLIAVCPIIAIYAVWFIWRDRRYGVLEDGLACVTRQQAQIVPWYRIADVNLTFFRTARLVLQTGESIAIGTPKTVMEQAQKRVND